MDIDTLIKKLRTASTKKTFRELGKHCDISHETIRRLVLSKNRPNVTFETYEKLQKGLETL